MRQPEATGWFGLSNVYASFAAFGVALSAAWLTGTRIRPRDPLPVPLVRFTPVAALAVSAAAVYLADSKGGYAFAAFGLALVALGALAARQRGSLPHLLGRAAPLLGPACVFGILAAVTLRGLIGERIGELSILFRWFYMQASLRIFTEHPATGVGPDGFQLAYLAAKNPLSPEEVSSPHSILLDWVATLGFAGFAWFAVLMAISIRLGQSLLSRDHAPESLSPADPSTRQTTRLALRTAMLTLASVTIATSWLETPYITLDTAGVRTLGLILGCLVVYSVILSPATRWISIGLAAGALAMLSHAQIELTGSAVASAGLLFVALGAGASAAMPPASANRSLSLPAMLGALACALVAGFALLHGALPARAWETDLRTAARTVEPIAEIADRFTALRSTTKPPTRDDVDRLSADLSDLLGRPVTVTPQTELPLMVELDRKLLPQAAQILDAAQRRFPDDWRIGREASRLYLRLLAPLPPQQRPSAPPFPDLPASLTAEYRTRAVTAIPTCIEPANAQRARKNPPRTRALALVHETLARSTDGSGLDNAATLLAEAFADDPYDLDIALRLFRLSRELDRPDDARRWAAKVLELDDLGRLDRAIRGLSSQDRRDAEAAAKPHAPDPSPASPPPTGPSGPG